MAREPSPKAVAYLLHVALHVAGVVFGAHSDGGVHSVHGPSFSNYPWSVPLRSFYTFGSHDGTIKRFPRIAFAFALHIITPAFLGNFLGSLLLMLLDGFGDPITGFENPGPVITVGETPPT